MKYRTFKLMTGVSQSTQIPKEFHIDTLNELTKKENWKVITTLRSVNGISILLLEKKK